MSYTPTSFANTGGPWWNKEAEDGGPGSGPKPGSEKVSLADLNKKSVGERLDEKHGTKVLKPSKEETDRIKAIKKAGPESWKSMYENNAVPENKKFQK